MKMEDFEVSSLEKICIKAFVQDFDNLLITLNRDENNSLKDYLQRKLSNTLSEEMHNQLRSRHAAFMINRYLRRLNLNVFDKTDIHDVMKILEQQGEGILAVFLSENEGIQYSKDILVQLAHSLPSSLTSLSLVRTGCSDIVLKIVASKCPNLQRLDLNGCAGVTDEGIAVAFSNSNQLINNNLRHIDLFFTSVTMRGMVLALDNCPNLTEFFHHNIEDAIGYIYRRHNSQFRTYNLETLVIWEELEAVHAVFPNVKSITLCGIKTQRQVDVCQNFPRLEKVRFHSLATVSLSPLLETRGSTLQNVSVSENIIIHVESLIQFCPRIQELSLCRAKLESRGRECINITRCPLRNLKKIVISHMNIEADARQISNLFAFTPNLETLSVLHVTGFSHAVNTVTEYRLPGLKAIEFCIADDDAQSIRKFINVAPNLKRIRISCCGNITRAECENLLLLNRGLQITYNPYCDFCFF